MRFSVCGGLDSQSIFSVRLEIKVQLNNTFSPDGTRLEPWTPHCKTLAASVRLRTPRPPRRRFPVCSSVCLSVRRLLTVLLVCRCVRCVCPALLPLAVSTVILLAAPLLVCLCRVSACHRPSGLTFQKVHMESLPSRRNRHQRVCTNIDWGKLKNGPALSRVQKWHPGPHLPHLPHPPHRISFSHSPSRISVFTAAPPPPPRFFSICAKRNEHVAVCM